MIKDLPKIAFIAWISLAGMIKQSNANPQQKINHVNFDAFYQSALCYVDNSLSNSFHQGIKNVLLDPRSFHLFSHGRPGQLFINGLWMDAKGIAQFLLDGRYLKWGTSSINIYGCEFGQGLAGSKAVKELSGLLGISVAASTNITGIDGDWVLEIGGIDETKNFKNYQGNLQCTGARGGRAPGDDFDGDGICNSTDIDDDNDGILDTLESTSSCTPNQSVTGTNTSLIGWMTNSGLCYMPDSRGFWWLSETSTDGTNENYLLPATSQFPRSAGAGMESNTDSRECSFATKSGVNPANPFTSNHYVQYKITTKNFGESSYLLLRRMGWNNNASVQLEIRVSEDNFATYTTVFTPKSVNQRDFLFDNFYLIRPDKTYTLRVYFYASVSGVMGDVALDGVISSNVTCVYNVDIDTDRDGIPNRLDADSDGDGCFDSYEAGVTGATKSRASTDSIASGPYGANGLANSLENNDTDSARVNYENKYLQYAISRTLNVCADTDGDGIGDLVDIDDDNDGVLDEIEKVFVCNTGLLRPTAATVTPSISFGAITTTIDNSGMTGSGLTATTTGSATTTDAWYSNDKVTTAVIDYTTSAGSSASHFLLWATECNDATPGGDGPIKDFTVTITYNNGANSFTTETYTTAKPTGVGTPNYAQKFDFGQVFNNVTKISINVLNGWYDDPAIKNDNWVSTNDVLIHSLYNLTLGEFRFGCSHIADIDTDRDGIVNRLDLDSDGDGCFDSYEAGVTGTTRSRASTDSIAAGPYGTNGLANSLENNDTDSAKVNYRSTYSAYATSRALNVCADTDGDGIGDLVDIDDDNDGVLDVLESPSCYYTAAEASKILSVSSELASYSTNFPANTIDNNASTYNAFNGAINWVGKELYKLTLSTPLAISSMKLDLVSWALSSNTSQTFKMQGSNDNVGWTDLSAPVASTATTGTFSIANTQTAPLKYTYYRLLGVAGNSNYGGVTEIKLIPYNYSISSHPKSICTIDTDNDGTVNHLDLDSDGDGCFDSYEAGVTGVTRTRASTDSIAAGPYGANGLASSLETNDTDSAKVNYRSTYSAYARSRALNACADTDGDGIGDLVDIDDDNDGVLDVLESPSCYYTAAEASKILSVSSELASYSTNFPANTIDNNTSTYNAFNGAINWVGKELYKLTLPTSLAISRIELGLTTWALSSNASQTFKMQGSNDNVGWTDLSAAVASTAPTGTFSIANTQTAPLKYTYYRLLGVAGNSNYGGVTEIKLIPYNYSISSHPKSICTIDTDNDGTVNHLDLDSDGDGCFDSFEAGVTGATKSGVSTDSIAIAPYGSNGLANSLENNDTDSAKVNYNNKYTSYALSKTLNLCVDTDGDGTGDLVDIDDDNDGITDLVEQPTCYGVADNCGGNRKNDAWISWDSGFGTSTWTGKITYGTTVIDVTLTGPTNMSNATGVFFNNESETLNAFCPDNKAGPSSLPLLRTSGSWTLTFSKPLIDPRFHFWSYGSGGGMVPLLFTGTYPIAKISNGTTTNFSVNNTIHGIDNITNYAQGTIELQTELSSITFSTTQAEVWWTINVSANTNSVDLSACDSRLDTDNDGIPNDLDLDSDGDGCSDSFESGVTGSTKSGASTDSVATGPYGANGLANSLENNDTDTARVNYENKYLQYAISRTLNICADTDGDGIGDLVDIDDDNDGIPDRIECPGNLIAPTAVTATTTCCDASSTPRSTITATEAAFADGVQLTDVLPSPYVLSAGGYHYSNNGLDKNIYTYTFDSKTLSGVVVWTPGLNTAQYQHPDGPVRQFTITLKHTGGTYTSPVYTTEVTGKAQVFSFDKAYTGVTEVKMDVLNGWVDPAPDDDVAHFPSGSSSAPNKVTHGSLYNVYLHEFRGIFTPCDADRDGISNHLDLDSDGDGCFDSYEAGVRGATRSRASTDSIAAGPYGANGLANSLENNDTDTARVSYANKYLQYALSRTLNVCADTDGDGIGDLVDIDDDNDGVRDTDEGHTCLNYDKISCDDLKDYRWVVWTSTTGTTDADGYIDLPSGERVRVHYTGDVQSLVGAGEMNNRNEYCPYNGQEGNSASQMIRTFSGVGKVHKFVFSKPLILPVFQVFSLGSAQSPVRYDFTNDVKVIKSNGNLTYPVSGDSSVVHGAEGDGSLLFDGSVDVVEFVASAWENWSGLQVAAGFAVDSANRGSTCISKDTDGDGKPNHLDLDSDGDGCFDSFEAGVTGVTRSGVSTDSIAAGPYGTNGLANSLENNDTDTARVNYANKYLQYAISRTLNVCADTDGDGIGDLVDIDDDNDGILDTLESTSSCTPNQSVTGTNTSLIGWMTNSGLCYMPDSRGFWWLSETSTDGTNENYLLPATSQSPRSAGAGMESSTDSSDCSFATKSGVNPANPFTSNHYVQYKITTKNFGESSYLLLRRMGWNNNASVQLEIRVSEDNFATYTTVFTPKSVNQRDFLLDNFYLIRPDKTYTLRVYFYASVSGVMRDVALDGVISSNVTCVYNVNIDTDRDGIPNRLDADSDGDGCFDSFEAGVTGVTRSRASTDSIAAGPYGTNGLANSLENNDTDTARINYQSRYSQYAISDTLNACLLLPPTKDTVTVRPRCITCAVTSCPVADDIAPSKVMSVSGCGTPAGYRMVGPDSNNCYRFEPTGPITDTAEGCIVVCDSSGRCDTTIVILSYPPLPPTKDTVTVTPLCDTCSVTACPVINDIDPSKIASTSNCGIPAGYRVVGPNSNNCYRFEPTGPVTDTTEACIALCDSSGRCDTTIVILYPPQPPKKDTITVRPPCDTCSVTACPVTNDIDSSKVMSVSSCGAPAGYRMTGPDSNNCYRFEPTGSLTNTVEACIAVCDSNGRCDTTIVILYPPPPTKDTVTTTPLCATCAVTACPIADDIAPSKVMSVSSCGAPAGYRVVGPDSNNCYRFVPTGPVTDTAETCIAVCDSLGRCDTTIVVLYPPPPTKDTVTVRPRCATCAVTACPIADDIAPSKVMSVSSCGTPEGYRVAGPDSNNCYRFEPTGSLTDTAKGCIVVCDSSGRCDTTIVILLYPPLPPTKDTVTVRPRCATCAVTACPVTNDVDSSKIASTSSCGAPAGYRMAGPDSNNCYRFEPTGPLTDTAEACIAVCDSSGRCDTTIIRLYPPLSPPKDTVTVTPRCDTCSVVACPVVDGIDRSKVMSVSSCGAPAGYRMAGPDSNNCYRFQPIDSSIKDTVETCIVVCDSSGRCDTTIIRLYPPPPPPKKDTVTVRPRCATCAVTACPVVDGIDRSKVMSVSSCGATLGYRMVGPDSNNCYRFQPTDSSIRDTVETCIVVCDSSGRCDTTIVILLYPPLPPTKDTVTVRPRCATCGVTACPVINDIDPSKIASTGSCGTPLGYRMVGPDSSNCYRFESTDPVTDTAEACIVVCDSSGRCDTTIVIFYPPSPPTKDTVTVRPLCDTCSVLTCPITNDIDSSKVMSVSSCGTPAGYRMVGPDSNNCYRFQPIDSSIKDTVETCIVVCDSSGRCDTTIIRLYPPPPPPKKDTVTVRPRCATCTVTACPVVDGIDRSKVMSVSSCGATLGYRMVGPDSNNCYRFQPTDSSIRDTVETCIVVCDSSGRCDTTIVILLYPPLPPTKDTVTVRPRCATCGVTACPVINDIDPSKIASTGSCGTPLGYRMVGPDSSNCYRFESTDPVTDTAEACIVVCDSSGRCDTTIVIFYPPSPPTKDTVTVRPLCDTCSVLTCPITNDIDSSKVMSVSSCGAPAGYRVVGPDSNSCYRFQPTGSLTDTAETCIAICDSSGRCDTTIIRLYPPPPPPKKDTVTVRPRCATCAVTACPVVDGIDRSKVMSVSSCGATLGYRMVGPDSNNCFRFEPTGPVTDTAEGCIVVCDSSGRCDTTIVILSYPPLPPTKDTVSVRPRCATCGVTACPVINDIDPSKIVSTSSCGTPLGYRMVGPDSNNCYRFGPADSSIKDTVETCIVVCDSSGRCDTTIVILLYPPLLPTKDTVIEFLECDTCEITVCPVVNDINPSLVISTSSCGIPSGYTMAGPDADNCYTFRPTAPVEGEAQTCIVVCDGSGRCDTTIVVLYPPVIRVFPPVPPSTRDTVIVVPPCDTCSVTVCPVSDIDLSRIIIVNSCGAPLGYRMIGPDSNNCYRFQPADSLLKNTVGTCIVVCDSSGRCDTTIIRLSPPQPPVPPKDTVTVRPPCATCSVTACPVMNDIDSSWVMSVSSCGAPLGYRMIGPDSNNCYRFQPTGSVTDTAEACIVVCDSSGFCDTTIVVLYPPVPPSTTDTVIVVLPCATCEVTACPIIDDVNSSSVISTSICGTPSGYTMTGPDADNCYTFRPTAPVEGEAQTCIVVCDGSGRCDTTIVVLYPPVIRVFPPVPPSTKDTVIVVPPCATCEVTACPIIDDVNSSSVISTSICGTPSGYTMTGPDADNCYTFKPTGSVTDTAEACIAVCDNSGRCDTTIVVLYPPVILLPPGSSCINVVRFEAVSNQVICKGSNSGSAMLTAEFAGGNDTLTKSYRWFNELDPDKTISYEKDLIGVPAGVYIVEVKVEDLRRSCRKYYQTKVEIKEGSNGIVATISGSTTVKHNSLPFPEIMLNATGGLAPYTYTYSINEGTELTIKGNPSAKMLQSTEENGAFVYKLLNVQDSLGCKLAVDSVSTATITVAGSISDTFIRDITPHITILPTITHGITRLIGYVSIQEVHGYPTQGIITVFLSKDSKIKMEFDPTATNIGGIFDVDNHAWHLDSSVLGFYKFTTYSVIPAAGESRFGFTLLFNPEHSRGKLQLTSSILLSSGGESNVGNNVDTETIEYFIN